MTKYGRKGRWKGKEYFFTHYDPQMHMVYSPDIKSFVDNMYGMWVSIDNVEWLDEKENKT